MNTMPLSNRILLAVLSGAMASVAFLEHDFYYFAWICFVPLFFALDEVPMNQAYLLGLIAGFTNFSSSTYWIADFVMLSKGYGTGPAYLLAILYWLYSAQLFAILALTFVWFCRRTHFNYYLVFPTLLIAVFSNYPMLFPYRFADSQVNFIEILQIIEYTGPWAVDGLIALGNIAYFKFLRLLSIQPGNQQQIKQSVIGIFCVGGFVIVWCIYGHFSVIHWSEKVDQGEQLNIGIVQPNEKPSTERDVIYPGYMRGYPPEMAMTEQLASAGANLVIWPEARYKALLDNPQVSAAYQSNVNSLNISLMLQDIHEAQSHSADSANTEKFNTAIMLSPNNKPPLYYQKQKLIPFGESVPILDNFPILKSKAESFLGEFLNEMSPGKSLVSFHTPELEIIPLICYETVFPDFVASSLRHHFVNDQDIKPPKPKVIVALSSNGWFGSSHQPYQHVIPSLLRAIETRTPMVHVVNNGPSIVASPSGKLSFVSDFETAGGYLASLPYLHSEAANQTFYVRHPKLFVSIVLTIALILLAFALFRPVTKA